MAGSIGDLYAAGVDAEFLDEVSATLVPGKCAVVADVSEEWVTPVDTRMEALGGVVFRAARTSVQDDMAAREVAETRKEIAQLKIEHAQAHADRKAKLQAKIDSLHAKMQPRWTRWSGGRGKSRARLKPRCMPCRTKPPRPTATSRQPCRSARPGSRKSMKRPRQS